MNNTSKPLTQLYWASMAISHFLSLLSLLLMWLIGPAFFAIGWSFLCLFQIVGAFCGYRLWKSEGLNHRGILTYLKNTDL